MVVRSKFLAVTANWFIGVMCAAAFAILALRTRGGEANLIDRFGDDYRVYMQRTGLFLPRRRQTDYTMGRS